MRKKPDKQTSKVLFYLAIGCFIITLIQGILYYNTEMYPNPMFRWMMIVQNSIKAFGFSSSISISTVAGIIKESQNGVEIIVGYFYAIAMFLAPYCTIAYIYKIVERLLRIRHWNWWFQKKKTRCIIFGYNDEVKALLAKNDRKKYRIHLVSEEISDEQSLDLLRDSIIVHKVDLLKNPEDATYFLKQMELKLVSNIVLFEDSSAKNFSLYRLFHNESIAKEISLKDEIKFYCRCEDAGIQSILEDYHDANIGNCMDIEIVSLPELRVRQMLSGNQLHQYYLKHAHEKITYDETRNWHLHMLIVGFGKLGQQLLLQTMNQGVVNSENKIIIDVVDFNVVEKMSIFANNFSEEYVDFTDNEMRISSDKADGELIIRFHQMDIRFHEFKKFLSTYGDKENIFTYVAICLKNKDISLHCLSQVQQHLLRNGKKDDVCVAVRMEYDKNMSQYLSDENDKYKNVFVIEDTTSTISMDELLHDEVNKDAKNFNWIYSRCELLTEDEYVEEGELIKKETTEQEAWKELRLVLRNSNRALAYHQEVKMLYIANETFEQYFGVDGIFLKDRGNAWTCKSADKVAKLQNDKEKYPVIDELAKLEHRRWCYYMAACGWKRTNNPKGEKSADLKENPCLCTWDELVENKPDTCMYDMMSLILQYMKKRDSEEEK